MSDRGMMPLGRALYPLYYPARPYFNAIKHRGRLFHTRHEIRVLKSQDV